MTVTYYTYIHTYIHTYVVYVPTDDINIKKKFEDAPLSKKGMTYIRSMRKVLKDCIENSITMWII